MRITLESTAAADTAARSGAEPTAAAAASAPAPEKEGGLLEALEAPEHGGDSISQQERDAFLEHAAAVTADLLRFGRSAIAQGTARASAATPLDSGAGATSNGSAAVSPKLSPTSAKKPNGKDTDHKAAAESERHRDAAKDRHRQDLDTLGTEPAILEQIKEQVLCVIAMHNVACVWVCGPGSC
nr:hypothetical protein HK105_002183 [Polyrhizophydium stewartii]